LIAPTSITSSAGDTARWADVGEGGRHVDHEDAVALPRAAAEGALEVGGDLGVGGVRERPPAAVDREPVGDAGGVAHRVGGRGQLRVPGEPGLGIEIDERHVEAGLGTADLVGESKR
jgi:hypothetical protein